MSQFPTYRGLRCFRVDAGEISDQMLGAGLNYSVETSELLRA